VRVSAGRAGKPAGNADRCEAAGARHDHADDAPAWRAECDADADLAAALLDHEREDTEEGTRRCTAEPNADVRIASENAIGTHSRVRSGAQPVVERVRPICGTRRAGCDRGAQSKVG
jgi:hypothetical protein